MHQTLKNSFQFSKSKSHSLSAAHEQKIFLAQKKIVHTQFYLHRGSFLRLEEEYWF